MANDADHSNCPGPAVPLVAREQTPVLLSAEPRPVKGLLRKLGLDRPELRAWAMYDWANSAFVTTIMTAVFPIYFSRVACAGLPPETATSRFSLATTLGLVMIAAAAPILGAVADFRPLKKRLLGSFLAAGVITTGLMFFVRQGDWLLASVLFVLANIAANGSFVFYDSLLPHIAREDEMDRVSTAGYALGYIGGGLLLALNLAWIQEPAWFGLPDNTLPVRLAFVSVAVWWAAFSVPLFRRVPEPKVLSGHSIAAEPAGASGESHAGAPAESLVRAAFAQLRDTFHQLRGCRNAFVMLLAFLIYNDGIGTIIRMAAIYGAEIGIRDGTMIAAILMTQFVGIPFAFLFGGLATRIGTRRAIFLGLAVYTLISVLGYFMKTGAHFVMLAALVGTVQGGTQALSRSLFASLIPRHKSGQFFGFFAVVEKFAGIFGPLVFWAMISLTGTSRAAILSVIAFFVTGGLLLFLVDVQEGQRSARQAEAQAVQAEPDHKPVHG